MLPLVCTFDSVSCCSRTAKIMSLLIITLVVLLSGSGAHGSSVPSVPVSVSLSASVSAASASAAVSYTIVGDEPLRCVFLKDIPNPKRRNETIIANVTEWCQTGCNLVCISELNRGCELAPSPSPIGGPFCYIKSGSGNVCRLNGQQLVKTSCRICNTSADPTAYTPAALGSRCNNKNWCDGDDHCTGDRDYPACTSTGQPVCPKPSYTGCSGSSDCSEDYHCNAQPGVKCSDNRQIAGPNDPRCTGNGTCQTQSPVESCQMQRDGRYCILKDCATIIGVCSFGKCNVTTCPPAIPAGSSWQTPIIGAAGGSFAVVLFAIGVYVYYRRRRAALQNHLTTMYWKMDQPDVETGEANDHDEKTNEPTASVTTSSKTSTTNQANSARNSSSVAATPGSRAGRVSLNGDADENATPIKKSIPRPQPTRVFNKKR